jgi:hypothetical protein
MLSVIKYAPRHFSGSRVAIAGYHGMDDGLMLIGTMKQILAGCPLDIISLAEPEHLRKTDWFNRLELGHGIPNEISEFINNWLDIKHKTILFKHQSRKKHVFYK